MVGTPAEVLRDMDMVGRWLGFNKEYGYWWYNCSRSRYFGSSGKIRFWYQRGVGSVRVESGFGLGLVESVRYMRLFFGCLSVVRVEGKVMREVMYLLRRTG